MAFTKLGALWLKRLDDGREFTNGVITIDGKETRISLLPNKYKTEAKHPDWILVLDERAATTTTPPASAPASRPATAAARPVSRFGRPAPAPAPAGAPDPGDFPIYDPNDPGGYVPPDEGVPF